MSTKKTEKNVPEELKESVHKVWLAGLGALATAEEEGSKLFRTLVEKGETYETKGKGRFEDLKGDVRDAADKAKEKAESTWDKVEGKFDDTVASTMRRLGVPNREEIATLTKRVEELTAVVEQLRPAKEAPKKPVAVAAAK